MSKRETRVASLLRRLRRSLDAGRVLLTRKAADEAASELGFQRGDVFEVLGGLTTLDFDHTTPSIAIPGDLIWVFTPEQDGLMLWIRLVERQGFFVVSFHEA